MKAKLESKELQNRGVEITSETGEEATMLLDIWNSHGRLVALSRDKEKHSVTLSVAPTPEKEGDSGKVTD